MTSTGSESDTESSVTDCSISDSESESDYSVGKPEPEGVEAGEGNDDGDYATPSPLCLVCPVRIPMEDLWNHLKSTHGLDILSLRLKLKMDQLAFIKLINFIRREIVTLSSRGDNTKDSIDQLVGKISKCTEPLWESDKYLQPVIEEDPVLSYWFDEEEEERAENSGQSVGISTSGNSSESSSKCLEELKNYNSQLLLKSQQYEEALSEAYTNMKLMKEVMNRICGEDKLTSRQLVLKRYNEALNKHNSDYFESYDDLQIHATMINDTQRTEAYRDAILNNTADFKNKVVLDVGCGTSILSMFAAKAGASKVYAVDRSNILDKAVQIVRENELQNIIECIKGTVETTQLPEKVDIIISEFMGYFLLFEGMLSSFIDARKKFLRPGGAMYPNTADIFIMGISEMDKFEEISKMWDDVYGFKMTALKAPRKLIPLIEAVKNEKCVTKPVKILSLDLMTCEYDDAAFRADFILTVTEEKPITGIVGYFDVGFTIGSAFQNSLSTGPDLPETHWYQTNFPLPKPILAKKGDTIPGVFECRPNLQNPRSLDITVTIAGETHTYLLD